MTTIAVTDLQIGPKTAHEAVSMASRRPHERSPFTEVRAARRQRALQIAAVTTGIVSVTAFASAAAVIVLSA